MFTGELISLGVAVCWTITAICFEYAGKRIGALSLNIIRLGMAIIMLGVTLYCFTGYWVPMHAGGQAWFWLAVSGFIGYVLGDYCLFNSYLVIGSRFGQLFMTLAPPSAAIAGFFILGEKLPANAWVGMLVTMFGIGLSIFSKGTGDKPTHKIGLKLPIRGVLLGIGAGVGQGVGLVFSKLGMGYFMENVDTQDALSVALVPFASTQIRAFVGLAGFLAIMAYTGQWRSLVKAFTNLKAMTGATFGTFFGPFVGVSFSLMAVQYTEAGIASTIMALTPILILLPSRFAFRQRITKFEVIGAIISVAGVSLFFI